MLSRLLKKLDGHQYAGWPRTLQDWAGTLAHQSGTSSDYCAYHSMYGLTYKLGELRDLLTDGTWPKLCRLASRYIRFVRWMREDRHAWQQIREIHYADNSVAVVERSRLTGENRYRTVVWPGGDVCY